MFFSLSYNHSSLALDSADATKPEPNCTVFGYKEFIGLVDVGGQELKAEMRRLGEVGAEVIGVCDKSVTHCRIEFRRPVAAHIRCDTG